MEKEKHYFLTYEWRKRGFQEWNKANCVTKMHPVAWLKVRITSGTDQYILVSWQEIDREHYMLIAGWID